MVISVEHLTVDLPVYRAGSRSLKGAITDLAVGGIFRRGRSGTLVVRALDDLSFELKQGDRLALIGHNGAGKTTLLRTLAGVYRPTGGTVTADGEVSNMFDIQLGLDPEASGRENIYLLGYSRGLSAKSIGAAIPEVIEFSGLGAYIDLPVKTYSTGMGSRLAFAVATSFAPDILLMDEWISTGDAEFIARAEARLQERVGQARIVVLASHDFNLIRRVCNRVLVLHHGRMVGMGGPHDIDALLARREEVNTLPPEAGPAASA